MFSISLYVALLATGYEKCAGHVERMADDRLPKRVKWHSYVSRAGLKRQILNGASAFDVGRCLVTYKINNTQSVLQKLCSNIDP